MLNLVYIIKKIKRQYVHFKIKGSGKIIKELEISIDSNLLRYMTVKVKKFDLETNYFEKEEFEKKKITNHNYAKKEKR